MLSRKAIVNIAGVGALAAYVFYASSRPEPKFDMELPKEQFSFSFARYLSAHDLESIKGRTPDDYLDTRTGIIADTVCGYDPAFYPLNLTAEERKNIQDTVAGLVDLKKDLIDPCVGGNCYSMHPNAFFVLQIEKDGKHNTLNISSDYIISRMRDFDADTGVFGKEFAESFKPDETDKKIWDAISIVNDIMGDRSKKYKAPEPKCAYL
jgi:hypothetical protein